MIRLLFGGASGRLFAAAAARSDAHAVTVRSIAELPRAWSLAGSRRFAWQPRDVDHDAPRHRRPRNDTKRKINRDNADPPRAPRPEVVPPDEPTVTYEPSELSAGRPMLERILADLKESGTTFILPMGDEDTLQEILKPIRSLLTIGVRPEFLISACSKRPELFKHITTQADNSLQMIHIMVDSCGMKYEDSIRMFASYGDSLLEVGCNGVQQRLDALVASGVPAGKYLGAVIRLCPALLFARQADDMRRAAEALSDFFSRKEISAIIQRCPSVLMKNMDEIEQKYEYIFYQMCIEGVEFMKSGRWAELPLDEIIMRHEFLLKTGRYTTPDPKHPQSKMENPELHRILDSSDDHFAVQVAGVSREEWIVYRSLAAKWAGQADKPRPFERVKPSQRKAFERRRKETVDTPDHVFDVAARADGAGTVSHPMHRSYASLFDDVTNNNNGGPSFGNIPAHFFNGMIGHQFDTMTIDEHLRSMPTPPSWIDAMQFRHPQDFDMLCVGGAMGMAKLGGGPSSCQQQQPVIVSRCDATVPSVSDASSSSCSPSTSENITTNHNSGKTDASMDTTTVADILRDTMKSEPPDDYHQAMMGMHTMHMGYPPPVGRSASSSSMSVAVTSSLPSSVRRTRSAQDGMLKCQFCPKKWADEQSLQLHMQDCRQVRIHECAQCLKRFKARGGLQQHMRIHNNDRPYACHYCAKRFTQKSHVDQHERIHTGAKPFTCQYCGRAFRQRSQQLGHEATHTHTMDAARHSELPRTSADSAPSDFQTLHTLQPAVSSLLALSQVQAPPTSVMSLCQAPPPSSMALCQPQPMMTSLGHSNHMQQFHQHHMLLNHML